VRSISGLMFAKRAQLGHTMLIKVDQTLRRTYCKF